VILAQLRNTRQIPAQLSPAGQRNGKVPSDAQPGAPVTNHGSGSQSGDPVQGLSSRFSIPCLLEG